MPIITPLVRGWCLPNRVFVQRAFDDESVSSHGPGDGKKRVTRQKESNKNGREAKSEHNKAAGRPSPAITVVPADLPGVVCFDDEVKSSRWGAGPPSFIAVPESLIMPGRNVASLSYLVPALPRSTRKEDVLPRCGILGFWQWLSTQP